MEKLETLYTPTRKMVGRLFNSRTLSVGMLPYKREQLRSFLSDWCSRTCFNIQEIAILLGQLEDHTKYARWARSWYFALMNALRHCLVTRFKALEGYRIRHKLSMKAYQYKTQLPKLLADRLSSLIARDKAQVLWHAKCKFEVTMDIKACLEQLHRYVAATTVPWDTPFGMIIPREPHFETTNDACTGHGAGGVNRTLEYFFDIGWSPRIKHGLSIRVGKQGHVHVNHLEFIGQTLQFAAIIVRLRKMTPAQATRWFPHGVPDIPV